MKLNRIRKNARYSFAYGCSVRRFKKVVRSSPDDNIKRIPARLLARICKEEGMIRGRKINYIWIDEV